MPRPDPTYVYHITRVEHLRSMIESGLWSDTEAQHLGLTQIEIGTAGIKAQRARREVPVDPGGVVADYAPFYYAPRSPMLAAIHNGKVDTYTGGCEEIVYLVSSTQRLRELGHQVVGSDRNAALFIAKFAADDERVTKFTDWPLMTERYWFNTESQPDRRERRQAECLVHGCVPWRAFLGIAAKTERVANIARQIVGELGHATPVFVRADWYF